MILDDGVLFLITDTDWSRAQENATSYVVHGFVASFSYSLSVLFLSGLLASGVWRLASVVLVWSLGKVVLILEFTDVS